MQRENKFRVWCKDHNEWEKDRCFLSQDGVVYQMVLAERVRAIRPENHVVQFFTGFCDKKGVAIYEGDILYCIDDFADDEHSAKFTALWDDGGWVFQKKGDEKYGGGHPWHEVNKDCEIIGNIYETPELLK